MTTLTEEQILQLVSERESARVARRFTESDAIRERLRAAGVELYDKEREWRARDGRRGVLFTAGPVMCTLSDTEIQERINLREEARAGRDFAQADTLRDELRRQGVELEDRTKTWRTAQGRQGTYSGGAMPSAVGVSDIEINSAIADRERARAAQDFATADEIRRRLSSLGVEIYDNQRLWKANDGRQGTIITGGVDNPVACTLSETEIALHIHSREEARAQKDWTRGDAIRDELRTLGVELIDSEQKWRTTDGRTGSYSGSVSSIGLSPSHAVVTASSASNSLIEGMAAQNAAILQAAVRAQALAAQQGAAVTPTTVVAGGGGALSQHSIDALVHGREVVRQGHDFTAADQIREDLRAHGVEVWDKQRIWKAADGRQGAIPAVTTGGLAVGTAQLTAGIGGLQTVSPDIAALMQLASRIPASR